MMARLLVEESDGARTEYPAVVSWDIEKGGVLMINTGAERVYLSPNQYRWFTVTEMK